MEHLEMFMAICHSHSARGRQWLIHLAEQMMVAHLWCETFMEGVVGPPMDEQGSSMTGGSAQCDPFSG